MDIKWLEDFLALAETGNFSRAAEELGLTQAAVSYQICQLEDRLGRALAHVCNLLDPDVTRWLMERPFSNTIYREFTEVRLAIEPVAAALAAHWHFGDRRFAEVGATMGSATGLGDLGVVSVFDPAHTAGNYLMREMIFVVGRKHVAKLRVLALILACLIPAVVLMLPAHPMTTAAAVVIHLIGAFAARWLFFAQAEHVVGLYYGKR